LSGVAFIAASSGPTFRVDHTVIGTGHHRLLLGAISGGSATEALVLALDRLAKHYDIRAA
jgi:hypothetical protein